MVCCAHALCALCLGKHCSSAAQPLLFNKPTSKLVFFELQLAFILSGYAADSAFFWADGANTSAITGHWLDIAREVRSALMGDH